MPVLLGRPRLAASTIAVAIHRTRPAIERSAAIAGSLSSVSMVVSSVMRSSSRAAGRDAVRDCSTTCWGRERDKQARMVGGAAQVDQFGTDDDEFGCRRDQLHAAVIDERGIAGQAGLHVRAVA